LNLAKASAPTTITRANTYLQIGASEQALDSYRIIGLGYSDATAVYPETYIGMQEKSVTSWGYGDLVFGNRESASDVAPTEHMRIQYNGNVGIGTTNPKSALHVVGLPVYANNAAAVAGGLTAGAFYRTGGDPDPVCVVH